MAAIFGFMLMRRRSEDPAAQVAASTEESTDIDLTENDKEEQIKKTGWQGP